jgi:MFS family permease
VYRDVLSDHDTRVLIGASAASQLGDWLYNAALLGYIYTATGSAAWVGAATVFRLLPYVLLGPVGGMLADRHDRRSVLLAGDGLRLLTMLALAAAVAADGPVIIVIALTALASAAGTAEKPAAMALLPRLVGETRLGTANALLHTVQDLGVVVGPAIGALLLAVAPAWVAFVVNAATFALSATLVSTMRKHPVPARSDDAGGALEEVVHGVRAARTAPFVVPLLLVVAMVEFTYGAQAVQLVVYAERQLDLAGGYGYLLAASGIGGLLSAIVNHRLAASTAVSAIVGLTGATFCATQLVYAGADAVVIALVVTVLGGIGMVACEVVAETTLARTVGPEVIGRVMGVFDSLSVAAMVLGALVAPGIIGATSLRTSLLVTGAAALAITVGCLIALRGLDELSRARAGVLASRVAVIAQLPIAAGVPRALIEQLASASQLCPLPPGVDVVVQGAPAHAFYAVADGSVIVHRDGREVARLGPGGCFGERGLLDRAPRNASVTTEVATTVLRLEGDVLLDVLQAAPTMLSAFDVIGVPRSATAATAMVDDPTWTAA